MTQTKQVACDGKFGYACYTSAEKAMKHKRLSGIKGRKLKVYLCKFCKKYHLGSSYEC